MKLVPMAWMAYKWFKGQKSRSNYNASRYSSRDDRR